MKKLFHTIHDPAHIWADSYFMFENLMNLGLKELYYRETSDDSKLKTPQESQSEKSTPLRDGEMSTGRKTYT